LFLSFKCPLFVPPHNLCHALAHMRRLFKSYNPYSYQIKKALFFHKHKKDVSLNDDIVATEKLIL
jgi:hypothetical protein